MTAKDRYKAGHADLVYWLRSRGEILKRSGSEWEWKHQDERVTVRHNVWFDQYTQEGGDAVKFLQYFYGTWAVPFPNWMMCRSTSVLPGR